MDIQTKARIRELKDLLKESDHYILKIQEHIALGEYVPQYLKDKIVLRREWREELNALEQS